MIFTNTETQFRFIEIINNRAAQRSDWIEGSLLPSETAEYLSFTYGISTETASKMVWGEKYSLSVEEQKALSSGLDLQDDLFSLIVQPQPSSKEIIIHTLEKVAMNYLEPAECQGCAQLESLILDSDLSGYRESEIYVLVLDSLEHIVNTTDTDNSACSVPEVSPAPFEDYEIGDLFEPEESLTPALTAAFENLSRNQQLEILTITYKKLDESGEESRQNERTQTLMLLRNRYLKPLAKNIFDELSHGPKIGMSASDLIEKLNLTNRRSIGQLERSVNNSIQKLNEENLNIHLDNPLKTLSRGNEKHYLLDSDIIKEWRAAIEASNKTSVANVS